jgi:hypothetical protein
LTPQFHSFPGGKGSCGPNKKDGSILPGKVFIVLLDYELQENGIQIAALKHMPCLILVLAAAFPRIAIALLFFFSNFFDKVYSSLIVLVLGFLFLPLTTIVYAWIVNGGHAINGIYLIAIVISVVFDLGHVGHGEYRRRRLA